MTLLIMMLAIVISSVVFRFVVHTDSQATQLTDNGSFSTNKNSKTSDTGPRSNNTSHGLGQASSIQTTHAPKPEAIVFDPNTADAETLKRVGLAAWQVKSIMNYRAKGGVYHRKEDMKRLYGLTYGQWEHIEPLIRISKEYQYIADNEDLSYNRNNTSTHSDTAKDNSTNGTKGSENTLKITIQSEEENKRVVKLHKGEKIDINLNDTLLMQRIPGIGPVKAYKLSKYISKLGGLASANQLNDVALADMPLGMEDYIDIDQTKIRKLRVNKLDAKQLYNHPYINWNQAKQLTERIRMYGPVKNWNDILFLSEFTQADKIRLEPYISFE